MSTDPAQPPPPPPRPLTRRAARAAWTEPAVRLWWAVAAAILAAVLAYAGQRLWVRHGEGRLIAAGVPVMARVVGTGDHSAAGQTADAGVLATVEFPWHGQPVRSAQMLTINTRVGATIPIHVGADDPAVWTDQTAVTPVADTLAVGLAVLPVAAAFGLVAAGVRAGVARTVRLGDPAVAVVADRRQVPIAPLSYAVRCSLRDGPDRRLRTVYVPRAGRSLAKGDELWVLLRPRGRAVAAMWFGEGEPRRHGEEVGRRESGDVSRAT